MPAATPLQELLATYRAASKTEREKGNYFEELTRTYLRNEPTYADLYSDVWLLSEVPDEYGISRKDTGIDLVAKTHGTGELHAIQCKFYDHQIKKSDIDSFFTASGQKPFRHRVIVATTNDWSENAEDALLNQQPPVTRIDLLDLETSQIDWAKYQTKKPVKLKPKYGPRPHQQTAITRVTVGLEDADRGKLIMACGTGKTFTSLKIAEELAGKDKRVLFLVPSLALISQTLTEWTQQSTTPLHSFAVCSDSEIGKKRQKDDDIVQTFVHELRYPASTNPQRIAEEMTKRHDAQHMSVVFSTYHSIEVLHKAQQKFGLPDFDLIICDEAHRTTGATFDSELESAFVRVHDNSFIKAAKRLYMTATPRIYADIAKAKALQEGAELCSMDDEELYGKQLHVITFSEAVELGLLTDYKVIVLTIDEDHVSERLQNLLKDDNNQLKVDDAARIIGCWKALAKQGLAKDLDKDTSPMQKAVAFCQVIEPTTGKRTHKVSSKQISEMFQTVVDAYLELESRPDQANPNNAGTAASENASKKLDQPFATKPGSRRSGNSAASVRPTLRCEAAHVDGSMNATTKGEKIGWLKEETDGETCRILCNVRCLSEGVDVPALDAVLFLSPRSSQVEVVQSVGRVMRNAPGKKRGYVVLPVVIPHGMEPSEALNDNKVYKVVWEVLQALRSHDDRFDAFVNKLDLMSDNSGKMEVISVTDTLSPKSKAKDNKKTGKGEFDLGDTVSGPQHIQQKLQFEVEGLERALYAKLVKKCGNRMYWEDWANDIAGIAGTHISRITAIVHNAENKKEVKAFKDFANEIRDDLNDSISDEEVIEMLAQHLITKPVFDALFADYSFASNNPVSKGMQNILDLLNEHRLNKEADTLDQFYKSVERRAAGIDNAEGKQKIVVELYDKFFRNAFPKMTERLGIVYTPVEVVDFIIHSVNDILQEEFGVTLGTKGVHILDPFVGTGTFITRLMQSGLITPEQLPHKYRNEIHCNEIVLLAYYIAAINIEAVYHSIMSDHANAGRPDQANPHNAGASASLDAADNAEGDSTHSAGSRRSGGSSASIRPTNSQSTTVPYEPFEGILLTDTFAMYESDDLIEQFFPDNSERRKRQKKLDIRVIVGNPPYSIGQASGNDNNQNVDYPGLDNRIEVTYAKKSKMTSVKNLYDSYIRGIRWASDRVGDCGVIGLVTNAGFLESTSSDGMRKCLAEEFDTIYVFHLRGNQRTRGDISKREGGKIFGSGSRAPIAVSLLIKNPDLAKRRGIVFHDIGDYLSREEKLDIVAGFGSVKGVTAADGWRTIVPDKYGDWLKQRDDSFEKFIVIGDKKSDDETVFASYSLGVATGRDAWCYNESRDAVQHNTSRLVNEYETERAAFNKAFGDLSSKERAGKVVDFIDTDPTKISWTRAFRSDLAKDKPLTHEAGRIRTSVYRPYNKRWLYFDRRLNEMVYQMHAVFPNEDVSNRAIMIKGNWRGDGQLALMINCPVCLQPDGGGQCFPLYLFENSADESDNGLFANESESTGLQRNDAITGEGIEHFRSAYGTPGQSITKVDLFYYIYGLLHSPEYRERYADNLSKELPRIPAVKTFEDFQAFSQAGTELAHWHLNYETVDCYPVTLDVDVGPVPTGRSNQIKGEPYSGRWEPALREKLTDEHFYVRKMKFPKVKDPETKKSVNDKTTVIYNNYITVTGIPLEAYDYVVNGKSAIEWVMERQAVSKDKKSGIVNDANLWATETMNNAAYPLELLMRVVTVSLETMKIVNNLPKLDID